SQAEDGIRYFHVTGVQTCALPISFGGVAAVLWQGGRLVLDGALTPGALVAFLLYAITVAAAVGSLASLFGGYQEAVGAVRRVFRSEERRVGNYCRLRWQLKLTTHE